MYKYFISYSYSDSKNFLGFGMTLLEAKNKINNFDRINEIVEQLKEKLIREEDNEYVKHNLIESNFIILNYKLMEDKDE